MTRKITVRAWPGTTLRAPRGMAPVFLPTRKGFTLLEVLLASVAATLILAAVFGVFSQAIHLRDRAAAAVRNARLRERAESTLRNDLNCAYVSGGVLASSLTGGTNATAGSSGLTLGGGSASMPGYLRFTACNGRSVSGTTASDVQQIEYFLTPTDGGRAGDGRGGVLTRAVTRDLLDTTTQVLTKQQGILAGVKAMQVQFFDGVNWLDTWQYTNAQDTTSSSSSGGGSGTNSGTTAGASSEGTELPQAVKVRLVFAAEANGAAAPAPLDVLVPWPAQPFGAQTPGPSGASNSGGGGPNQRGGNNNGNNNGNGGNRGGGPGGPGGPGGGNPGGGPPPPNGPPPGGAPPSGPPPGNPPSRGGQPR